MNGNFNSVLLETAVDELSKLPGIGRKTALRLALHLLRKEEQAAYSLGERSEEHTSELQSQR